MAHRDGQAQLQGTLNLPLFACSDIGSDGFRGTFHRFGRHIQASQQFDLPPSMVEWRFRANQRQHASDTGRQIRFLYVQSCIGRTLPVMAVRTQIPGAQQLHLSQCGLHAPRTHLPVPGLVTAGTRHLALIRAGRIALQQLAQRECSRPVHGSPRCHLNGLQIESARLALLLNHKPEQGVHFSFEFLPDRLGRFFSCGVSVSSTGLARQIFSLVSIKVRFSSWYVRNPAISRSALRCAAGMGKLSVNVLPSIL